MANADVAWIDVLPSMANFLPQLTQGVNRVVPQAGQQAGRKFGESFGSSAQASVEQASSKMSTALKKVADSAGQVRVAEAKLKDTQESGKASAGQLAAAEERVAVARRNETAANRNLSSATAGMTSAQRRATEQTHLAGHATEETEKKTHRLTGALGGVKGAFAAGFGAFVAIKEATDFMGEAMKEASNMEAQVHRINVVFGEGSEAIQKWAEGAATRIGMSAQEALAGAGRFGTLFTTLGVGKEQAAGMSEKMVTLGADMAAFAHTSPATAVDALQKAMAGGTRGLRQFGIVLDANMIKQKAQAMGLYSGKGALDVNAKAQATYALVMEKSTRIQGDFVKQGGNVATKQKVLSAEWTNAKETLGKLVIGPAMGFVGFLTKIVPLLEKSMHFIQENSTWLKPLALGIAAVAVAWKLWNEAVELTEKIVEMSPMGKIILILTVIGVALVALYAKSKTFRDIVQGAFHAVVAAGKILWDVLKVVFEALAAAWKFTVTAVKFAWTNILKPVFDAIKLVVLALVHIFQFLFFTPLSVQWKALTALFKWLWTTILKPVFDAFGAAGKWLWNNVLKPAFDSIGKGWSQIGAGFKAIYDRVILPVWHAVQAAAGFMWNNVLKPIFDALSRAWSGVGASLKWVYDHVIKPIWDAFVGAVRWVQSSFKAAVDAIAGIWKTIEHALLTPVQWVIDIIWNNGLMALWNSISKIWGGHPMDPFKLPGFATGGVVGGGQQMVRAEDGSMVPAGFFHAATGAVLPGYTPGRDVHRFWSPTAGGLALSGGEAIMRPEFTAAVGPGWVDSMNAAARAGGAAGVRSALGFADGGIVGLGSRALNFLTGNPIARALTALLVPGGALIDQVTSYVSKEASLTRNGGGTPIYVTIGDMIRNGANEIWKVISSALAKFISPTGGGGSRLSNQLGAAGGGGTAGGSASVVAAVKAVADRYQWGVGAEWAALSNLINGESGWRPTAQNPTSTAFGLFQFLDSTWTSGKTSDPTGQATQGLQYIQFKYGDPINAWAKWLSRSPHWYDTGGLWEHGTGGMNMSGGLERVLSPSQDDYFRRFVDATSGQMAQAGKRMLAETIELHAPGVHQGQEIIDALWHRLQVADFGGVYSFAGE